MALLAQQEVCCEPRRVGVGRLGIEGQLAQQDGGGGLAPIVRGRAGHLEVVDEIHIVVDGDGVFPRRHRARQSQMTIDGRGFELREELLEQPVALFRTVVVNDGFHPWEFQRVDTDLADPLLVGQEGLEVFRRVFDFHQIGVVGGRVVIGVDAIPAPIRIAHLGGGIGRLRYVELRAQDRGQARDGGGHQRVPALLATARLDLDFRSEGGVVGAGVVHLDAGRGLEFLPQRQAFLLVDGGIDV